jgi:hypothetical protein
MNTNTAHAHRLHYQYAVLFKKTMFSLEGDPSVLERRPSKALPVAREHSGDSNADKHFGTSDLRA